MSRKNIQNPNKGELIVCRCERVTLEQIRTSIHLNHTYTANQVKKLTRAGMGPCQGRTCAKIVETIITAETGETSVTEPYKSRPPVRTIHLDHLSTCADQFKEPEGPVSVVMLRASNSENE